MAGSLHKVEVVQGAASPFAAQPPVKRSRRPLIFLLVFAVCLSGSLYYVFQRPAVYRATASLLTVAPPEFDQQSGEADTQHVTIQSQLLLGKPLLEQLLAGLRSSDQFGVYADLSLQRLRRLLSVVPVPDTNLVELRAEGPDEVLLAGVVNAWVEVYQQRRGEEISQASGKTMDALREQYKELEVKLVSKRTELEEFRSNNDISSMGREENQALARLKGLNKSLNEASDEEVKAKARLDSILAALERGETVVPDQDKRSLAQMEKRAQELRERLAELDRNYTREFFALSPTLEVIPEQLTDLERKIAQAKAQGRDVLVGEARREYTAARQAVADLQRQLEEHKQEAREFTARFAEHEAMQEDLVRLEELYRTTEQRLVQIEVQNREKYPQIRVVEWAFQPERPIWPQYHRDAGFALAGSLITALFAVWLWEFLGAQRQPVSPVTLRNVTIHPGGGANNLEYQAQTAALQPTEIPTLEGPEPRELSEGEIEALLHGADKDTRALIVLLMSGLTRDQIVGISERDFDVATGRLTMTGDDKRSLQLPGVAARYLQGSLGANAGWARLREQLAEQADLDLRLNLAAVDGGVQSPEQVDAEALRHTYIAYLVRQGIRLSELNRLVGEIPPKVLVRYGRLSPSGPGKLAAEITPAYPLLDH